MMTHGSCISLILLSAGLLMYFFHSKILERMITCGRCLVQRRLPKAEAEQDFNSGLVAHHVYTTDTQKYWRFCWCRGTCCNTKGMTSDNHSNSAGISLSCRQWPPMAMTSEPKFQMSIKLTKSMLRIQKTMQICCEPRKIRGNVATHARAYA